MEMQPARYSSTLAAEAPNPGKCNPLWSTGQCFDNDLGDWRVAYTRPRHEKSLARECEMLGILYYLPIYQKRIRRRDNNKPRKSLLPLFPGYLPFVDRNGTSRTIHGSGHVVTVLDVFDQRSFVRDLSQVAQVLASGLPIGRTEALVPGRSVRIADGPLCGMEGVIDRRRSTTRLLLHVEAFRSVVTVELDSRAVEVLS